MILAPVIAALSSVLVSVGIPLVAAQAIVGIGLAAGMYALQRLLTPRQRPPGQEFEAKAGANVPMFCVYGRQRLAGAVMPPVQTGRRVMHVRVLGIDWHDALEAIVIDGERCRFNGIDGQWSNAGKQFQGGILGTPDTGGDGTHIGDPPWTPGLQSAGADGSSWVTTKEYGNNVKVKFYDGRPVQNADATLVAQSGSDAQGNKFWTADHKGGGVCYAIVDIEPDSNKNLSANPQIEFIVRGRRLWDPRKDTTYGGTGSHSRANKATWEWSDNVALAATDYRLGVTIGGVKMMGIGTPISRIRMDSRIAAANLCDTPRPLLDDEEEPMWRIAAVITNERTHRDNLQIFYDAMAGWETERGGTYRLTAGGPQTPVVAITDADLVKGPRRYKAKKPRSDRYNAVAGKFADPWNAFELQDLPLRTSSEDEAIDGGERLTMTLTLSQVPSQTQAQHLMEIARRRMRLQATATVAVPPRLRDAETMDTVTWASTYHGGAAREFHIQQWKKQRDLTLSWGLVETSADIWDWDPEADQLDPLVAADLPSAAERLATVAGFAIAASYDVGEGGQKLPVFLCSWTPIADLTVDAVIVRYRPVGATDWSQQRFDTTDTLAAGEGKISAGIQAETDYEFEADLATTPPRYTTVQTPAPVTSDPNHVVKKAIITDTVEPGGVDFDALSAAVDEKLDDAFANANQALTDAQDLIAALSSDEDRSQEASARLNLDLSSRLGGLTNAVLTAQAAVEDFKGVLGDLGWERLGPGGASRFRAIDVVNNGLTTLTTQVNLLAGRVDFILAASTGDLSAVEAQLTTILVTLDALEGVVDTAITDINGAESSIVTLQSRMSAAEASILLSATAAELLELETRLDAAELAINAGSITAETIAGIQRTQEQVAEGVAGLIARLQGLTDVAFETAAATRLELSSSINDLGEAQATFAVELAAVQANASSQLLEKATVLASATSAVASRVSSLEATVNNPTTGLATRASASSVTAVQSQVDDQGDEISSLATRADTLEATVYDETTGLVDRTAAVETLAATKVDAAGATAAAQTLLNTTFGAGSAGVKWRLAALSTPTGYDALFEIEASVNGADGTYKSSGLLIAVLTVASVQVARFEAKADQFLFRLPSGDPVALIDEDGLLIADRFDVQEATSGERTRYTKSGMYVYDSAGTLRVAVGKRTPPA